MVCTWSLLTPAMASCYRCNEQQQHYLSLSDQCLGCILIQGHATTCQGDASTCRRLRGQVEASQASKEPVVSPCFATCGRSQ
ncbi:Os09g0531950 [Oryza sativa Japonica Group]|uniref:Os09g0531950 protein n=1 Tax=Oryza sativa subsp. japonica TaxID=39947 RepID=A0A0P0XQJ2_ORYSJ|nr:hypothetical protein EE612_049129 [Oryza sativa]BAT09109.1 Os09g0531950 [Oryza sativa Japonica Group]